MPIKSSVLPCIYLLPFYFAYYSFAPLVVNVVVPRRRCRSYCTFNFIFTIDCLNDDDDDDDYDVEDDFGGVWNTKYTHCMLLAAYQKHTAESLQEFMEYARTRSKCLISIEQQFIQV